MYKSGFPFIFAVSRVAHMSLNNRWLVVLLLILAVTLATVTGFALGNLNMNASLRQHSNGVVMVAVQGDSRVYTSDVASIPLNWGTVNFGDNTKTVTITNQANVNLNPHLTLNAPNLPRGWTLTFSLENQLIPAGQSATGTLTLNVPANTASGNYNWGASIKLDSTK